MINEIKIWVNKVKESTKVIFHLIFERAGINLVLKIFQQYMKIYICFP